MPTTITGTDGVSQVQAGAVESGDLASGAIGSGDLPAGSVIQVVQATSNTRVDINSSSPVDVEPSITITPSSASNQILVMHTAGGEVRDNSKSIKFSLERNGTIIWQANRYGFNGSGGRESVPFNASYLDSPNTTASVTYNFSVANKNAERILYNGDDGAFSGNSEAITIAMEIAG